MNNLLLFLFLLCVAYSLVESQTTIPIRNRYSSGSIVLATNAQLPFNASNGRTYAMWINPSANSSGWTELLSKSSNSEFINNEDRRPSFFVNPDSTRLSFVSDTDGATNPHCGTTNVLPLNQWTHVTFVHSVNSPTLSTHTYYFNGSVDTSCQHAGLPTTNTANLQSTVSYPFMSATVADLRYFPGALTQNDIQRIFAEARYNVDTTPPTLPSVSISSSPSPAAVGGTITLSFNSSEIITTPTVTILGRSAVVSGSVDGRQWTATVTVQVTDNLSAVPFSISNYLDYLNGNTGATVTSVTDSSFVVSSCNNTYPPTLFANMSNIASGNLNLVFHAPTNVLQTTFTFVGSSIAACHSTSATYWTSANSLTPVCGLRYSLSVPLNFALSNCNFQRDEASTSQTIFSSTIRAVTIQTYTTLRGLTLNRTLETSVNIRIAFATAINTTSSSLNVFGPRITLSRITSSQFNPITYELTLTVLTSVQSPYQLSTPSLTTVSGFTIVSQQPQTAESGLPLVAICASGITSPCTQYWTVVIRRTTSCSPGPSTLTNNGWLLNFAVRCHNSFTGSCATPDPNTDAVSFDTASDNYCPVLIDTESASASLTAFDSNTFTNQQNTFVFGARTHFRAVVSAGINIQALRVERVSIVSGGASGVSTLYSSPFSNANAYFSQAAVATYNNQPAGYTGTFAVAPTLMTVNDNLAGANNLQRIVTFSWIWSGATSSASTDAPVSTVVSADLRVRYANQSTVADHFISLQWSSHSKQSPHLLEVSPAVSSTVAVSVLGNNDNQVADITNGNNNNNINNNTSASITSTNIVIAAVGLTIALIAVVVIAAMVVKQRQHHSKEQLAQSSTLSSSPFELNVVSR